MKVAVLNIAGKVGKTTLAATMLSPRMNNAPIFAIETVNKTAEEHGIAVTEQMAGGKFKELFRKLMLLDDAIIDIGCSNLQAFLDGMVQFEDSHLEFDYFVVPVNKGAIEQRETIDAITRLAGFGIPAEKIRVVFNRVGDSVQDDFGPILKFAQIENTCIANTEAAVFESEVFKAMLTRRVSMADMLEDTTDYKTMAREASAAKDTALADRWTEMRVVQMGVKPL